MDRCDHRRIKVSTPHIGGIQGLQLAGRWYDVDLDGRWNGILEPPPQKLHHLSVDD